MPHYSKRDYEKVAAILKEARDLQPYRDPVIKNVRDATLEVVAAKFNLLFVVDNPRFDQDRFLEAAGITP